MDKVIVSNKRALTVKYSEAGLAKIEAAIERLVAADGARGIKTGCLYLDTVDHMTGVGDVVATAQDEAGAKTAVDAICSKFKPDYLVLLGGPDVVPHVTLDNPTPKDGDPAVPSDLPYASSAKHSRDINDFLDTARVVSRIPGPPGGKDADFLMKLLDQSNSHSPRSSDYYKSYFGISVDAWVASTQMSLNQIFGNYRELKLTPPASHTAIDTALTNPAHFVNCHGLELQPRFYSKQGNRSFLSIDGPKLAGKITSGTIVAAECCFGAQMYDHVLAGRDQPICFAYLENGAIGFVGSTNIAYGPESAMGAADLLTQFFWVNVLKGQSLGDAFLQARQQFIRRERMSDPANLKTIAQFILLGDASVHPCIPPEYVKANLDVEAVDTTMQRKALRVALASEGQANIQLASKMGRRVPAKTKIGGHADLVARVRKLAVDHGLDDPEIESYHVSGGRLFSNSVKAMVSEPVVTVATQAKESKGDIRDIRIIVAHAVRHGDQFAISSLRTYVSK